MSKIPTDIPNVFLIPLKNGNKRFWCSSCNKFLSNASEGVHTCDPEWRKSLPKRSSGAGKKRRWRMTDKRNHRLKDLLEDAALLKTLWPTIKTLCSKTYGKALKRRIDKKMHLRKLKSYIKFFGL